MSGAGASPAGPAVGRRALITGITGQDGSFLAELLLGMGYRVSGLVRRAPGSDLGLVEHLREYLEIVHGDVRDAPAVAEALARTGPQEVYHLAAPSYVPASWERPAESIAAVAGATATLLSLVREHDRAIRVFVAGSGAMFGGAPQAPQHELTPARPSTPYAVAKLAAHLLVGVMREHDGLHASSGIAYNHESERRPEQFVTRKISRAAAAVSLGLAQEVVLGDLGAVRDWSFAGDIMRGAWLMLQQERPDDYVLASGRAHTVAEFAAAAFACVGLDAARHVRVDPGLVRAAEATPSVGDPRRARERLGWKAEVDFEGLVRRMVEADVARLRAARPGA